MTFAELAGSTRETSKSSSASPARCSTGEAEPTGQYVFRRSRVARLLDPSRSRLLVWLVSGKAELETEWKILGARQPAGHRALQGNLARGDRGFRREGLPSLPHLRRSAAGKRGLRARLPLLPRQRSAARSGVRGQLGRLSGQGAGSGGGRLFARGEGSPHRAGRVRGLPPRSQGSEGDPPGDRPQPRLRAGAPPLRADGGDPPERADVRPGPGGRRA